MKQLRVKRLLSHTVTLFFIFVGVVQYQLRAGEIQLEPAFANAATVLTPLIKNEEGKGRGGETGKDASAVTPRLNPVLPADPEIPFGWDQYVVLREQNSSVRQIGGYDPGLQPAAIEVLPNEPVNIKISGFDANFNTLSITTNKSTAGLKEFVPFRVRARDITSTTIWNLIYDIRSTASRIRNSAFLVKSPGDIIQPGQLVRYSWTQTGRGEKYPKVEAEFSGRTGAATGLVQSNLTQILAVKFRPIVLGHYLVTITPRDVRGEPPRGSTSNGAVFRCAFGSQNLAPVVDGLAADTFLPAVNQAVTFLPIAVDPETGTSSFANQYFDFGDGVALSGVSGSAAHGYTQSGIYRVRCTLADDQGASAVAEDDVLVGAKAPSAFTFYVLKMIPPVEAGIGELASDSLTATFKGITAKAGDRIVFVYNRNRFGRISASDSSDDTDIVLKNKGFAGATRLAKNFGVSVGPNSISVQVSKASLDRTGDPRFGRAELQGVFKNQRIGICVYPADGTAPRVSVYTGNVLIKVKGGNTGSTVFIPEESISAVNTTKQPDPKIQDVP